MSGEYMSNQENFTDEILQNSSSNTKNEKSETESVAAGEDIKYYIYSFDIDSELKKAGEEKFATIGMTLEEGFVSYLRYAIKHPDQLKQWVDEEKDKTPIISNLMIYPVHRGQTDEEARMDFLKRVSDK